MSKIKNIFVPALIIDLQYKIDFWKYTHTYVYMYMFLPVLLILSCFPPNEREWRLEASLCKALNIQIQSECSRWHLYIPWKWNMLSDYMPLCDSRQAATVSNSSTEREKQWQPQDNRFGPCEVRLAHCWHSRLTVIALSWVRCRIDGWMMSVLKLGGFLPVVGMGLWWDQARWGGNHTYLEKVVTALHCRPLHSCSNLTDVILVHWLYLQASVCNSILFQ